MFTFILIIYIIFTLLIIFFILINKGKDTTFDSNYNNNVFNTKQSSTLLNKAITFIAIIIIFLNILINLNNPQTKKEKNIINIYKLK